MPNSTVTPMPTIGVDQAYIAKLLTDTAEGCTYDTPVALLGLTSVNVTESGEIGKFFADNGLYATYANPSSKEVEFSVAEVEPQNLALMTGATYANGLYSTSSEDKAPKFAFGYRRLRSDGSYRYVWLLKGSFRVGNESAETKGENVNFQGQTVRYVAENRVYDKRDRNCCDDNDPDLIEGVNAAKIATEWFKDPNADFMSGSVSA